MAGFLNSARPKLVAPFGYDTPARADLALAIAERDAFEATAAENEAAAARLDLIVADAYREQSAAERALSDALDGARARTVRQMIAGETLHPDPIIAHSRETIRECQSALLAVRDAKSEISAKRERGSVTRLVQGDRVKAAAVAVLAESPVLPDLVARVLHFQTNLGPAARMLTWAVQTGALALHSASEVGHDTAADKALRQAITQLGYHATALGLPGDPGRPPAPLVGWQEAFAALQKDAHAPLPDVA